MDIFNIHKSLIDDYSSYIRSFINAKDKHMTEYIDKSLSEGMLWPEPLIQLSPSFDPGETIVALTKQLEIKNLR
jgi:hypothetical protein